MANSKALLEKCHLTSWPQFSRKPVGDSQASSLAFHQESSMVRWEQNWHRTKNCVWQQPNPRLQKHHGWRYHTVGMLLCCLFERHETKYKKIIEQNLWLGRRFVLMDPHINQMAHAFYPEAKSESIFQSNRKRMGFNTFMHKFMTMLNVKQNLLHRLIVFINILDYYYFQHMLLYIEILQSHNDII